MQNKKIVDIRLTSNASKLTKDLSKLINAGLTHLSVSLDAFSEDIFKNEIIKIL